MLAWNPRPIKVTTELDDELPQEGETEAKWTGLVNWRTNTLLIWTPFWLTATLMLGLEDAGTEQMTWTLDTCTSRNFWLSRKQAAAEEGKNVPPIKVISNPVKMRLKSWKELVLNNVAVVTYPQVQSLERAPCWSKQLSRSTGNQGCDRWMWLPYQWRP